MRRYIDADKLQEEFKELHGGKRSLLIDTQPTADVRENVRGKWKRRIVDGGWNANLVCSECGYTLMIEDGYHFCPNCGADMRPITALSKNAEIVANLKRGEA